MRKTINRGQHGGDTDVEIIGGIFEQPSQKCFSGQL